MRSKGDNRSRDAAIARLAANQHGVVTTGQLVNFGLSRGRISERAAAGRLHRIHRGVYAIGHPRLSDEGRWMAAVLACGDGAVLSHRSAAELWGMRPRARRLSAAGQHGEAQASDVTVPGTAGRKNHARIALHRSSTLTARHCTRRHGIPVTTPERTLADLRAVLPPADLAAARREAEFLRLPIADSPIAEPTRTELERRFLRLCRRHRLRQPGVNVKLDRYEVDFVWAECRLVVELDGWESHRTRSAFEADRARDARLNLLGYDVLRFTWRQLKDDSAGVAKTIWSMLRKAP
jgi:very-short-patch-repair endonuclease